MNQLGSARFGPRVALIGLPGAGKTTLARALSAAFGWDVFSTGAFMRQLAETDPALASTLREGRLAPEPLVIAGVEAAHRASHERGLVLDGFPRHESQVREADRILQRWIPVVLNITVETVRDRIENRLVCARCGAPRSPIVADGRCLACGFDAWVRREDDAADARDMRELTFPRDTDAVLHALRSRGVVRIDATAPPGDVAATARRALAGC